MAYVQGVKFIKINKTDALGNDKTGTLSQLRNIRIKYSDIGVVQYDVFGKTEYPTYFLYQVNYKDSISPVDRGVSDYILQATSTIPPNTIPLSIDTSQQITQYDNVVIGNDRFNDGDGVYTIKSTEHYPNTPIIYTASVQYDKGGASFPIYPKLIIATGDSAPGTTIQELTPGAVMSPGTITISGSLPGAIPSDVNYFLVVSASSQGGGGLINFTNATLKISQSIAPTGNNQLLVVPSPDTALKFESTDCDVTYGFLDKYPVSQYFMDVDYSTGISIPTNQTQLISGSATLAPVKDYYYNLQAQTLPRYEGSRVTQYKLNEYTGPSNNLLVDGTPYQGDVAYGKSPNVELNQTYFVWFSEVYGASPEYNDAVNISVKYLVDPLGNTYSPGLTKYFQGELIDNFTQGQTAELNFVDANGGTNSTSAAVKIALNGSRTVIRSGVKASAVLYSQTGSSINAYTQSLQFTTIENGSAYKTLTDYRFGAQQYGTQTITTGTGVTKVQFGTTLWDFQSSAYNPTQYKYTFPSTPESKIRFKLNLGSLSNFVGTTAVIIRKNGNTTPIYRVPFTMTQQNNNQGRIYEPRLTTEYFNFSSSDYVEVFLEQISNSNITITGPVEWLAEQQLLTQQVLPSVTAPFFFTSSANPYILTASYQFSSSINQVYQAAITSSGFDPVKYKVSFEPGDQIRFENNELNTYTINKIISSSTQTTNGETYMLLDQPITNNTNINYFLLRRYAPEPSNIIIQGIKPSGGTGPGTFTPLYISQQLQDNMADIVSKLNSENTI